MGVVSGSQSLRSSHPTAAQQAVSDREADGDRERVDDVALGDADAGGQRRLAIAATSARADPLPAVVRRDADPEQLRRTLSSRPAAAIATPTS